MKTNDLSEKILIEASEETLFKFYCENKGIDLTLHAYEYIKSFKKRKVKYSEIQTVLRYDEKIRNTIYKFISFLEEKMRAYICNNFANDLTEIKFINKIQIILKKEGDNFKLFDTLNSILFSELVSQVNLLSEEDKSKMFLQKEYNHKNLLAIVELRNAVFHNRFILNYRNFKKCVLDNGEGNSLRTNLINLSNHFCHDVKIDFLKEIKKCAKKQD